MCIRIRTKVSCISGVKLFIHHASSHSSAILTKVLFFEQPKNEVNVKAC